MIELLLTLTAAAGAVQFEAQTLDGQLARGSIASLDSQQLVLETADGPAAFPLANLAVLVRTPPAVVTDRGSAMLVELVDGTSLVATEYTATDGKSRIDTLEVPTGAVRWVRFAAPEGFDARLAKQWLEITETKAAGDLLVVNKNGSLDYLEGVLRDVDPATCQFELDDETIPVKRAKITGLIYASAKPQEESEGLCKLATTTGSRLQVKSFETSESGVTVTTLVGTTHVLPLDKLSRCDFSSGKISYLSDLEPEKAKFTPLFGFAQPPPGVLEFYQFRRDQGFTGEPLRLDGKTFRKGLALASRTELVYRLPDRFRVFRATVGIDDSVRTTGSMHVEIKGDGKSLWQGEVRGDEPAQELELEIAGVRRLEVVADYGDGLDVGDRLDLAEARVTK